MLLIKTSRDNLLQPLQAVSGIVERRHTLPILSNVLIERRGGEMTFLATDIEIQIRTATTAGEGGEGAVTVAAKKLQDILRSLPDNVDVTINLEDKRLQVKAGRSRFNLQTLPAEDFPRMTLAQDGVKEIVVAQKAFKGLLAQTQYAMAAQDVRYYLNGLLLLTEGKELRAVATDGHRLAMCALDAGIASSDKHQVIVPRKGILELARLLAEPEELVSIVLGQHHIRATTGEFTFTSKLVDGKFPDYQRVLPRNGDKVVVGERQALREAFSRTAILSNEKYRGIRLQLARNLLKIQANNPEQEEAEEEVVVDYNGGSLEIGFNVSYLLDVLGVMTTEQVRLILSDANSSALVQEAGNDDSSYVVMPMRL